ncbi:MAG: squalene/phytoene synthase family protein [Ahrensia sp.]|nr:squalene/phytoene synthase family protein [Ahrensia sp.]
MERFSTVSRDDLTFCLQQLRIQARDGYLASLLVPDPHRDAVTVLQALHAEIVGIALAAPEPLAGEIRLQWWIEVLERKRDDEAAQNPLARALLSVLTKAELPAKPLISKCEAHIFDLYSDPMRETSVLEAYFGETRSVLFQLSCMAVDEASATKASDASGHAGVATGCVALLEHLARHRVQQRLFIPSDILQHRGLSRDAFFEDVGEAQASAVQDIANMALEHHGRAASALDALPSVLKPIFAPLALVPLYAKRAAKHPQDTLAGLPDMPQWRVQWALFRW